MAGVPLKSAAKLDRSDQEYFDSKNPALMNNPLVEFIGEGIGSPEKNPFLGNALELLFRSIGGDPLGW